MIAREGWPWIIAAVIVCAIVYRVWGTGASAPFIVMAVWLYFLFRDPGRNVPPLPLAVIAPVDGRVLEVTGCCGGELPGDWTKITISASHLGAYTVRSPIEGVICDLRDREAKSDDGPRVGGLWVRSEENDEVIVLFPECWSFFAPKAFVRYGERVGQGQRFAYLRLAPKVEVYVPVTAIIGVAPGDRVLAGSGVMAQLADK